MLKIVKRNDTKDTINYQLLDDDGSPVNLTGATVNFVMGKKNKLITDSPAVVTAANDGIVEYQLAVTDTLVSGTFLAEFVVTFSNGLQKTFPNNGYITVTVEQNLDTNQTNVIVDMIAAKQGDFEAKLTSILQLNSINVTAMNEYKWTATEGQLVYTFPATANYSVSSKWFQVYVGNIPVDDSLVNRLNNTQFSLIIDSSHIKAGMIVSAKWTEPVVPITGGHHGTHELGGQDSINITQLVGYQENVASPLSEKAKLADIQKRQKIVGKTEGIYDAGAVMGIIGNRESDAKIQVSGFANSADSSKYTDRDSVGLYISNTGANPTLDVTTATYGSTYVDVVGDLSGIKAGMIVDTKHTPNVFSAIVDSVVGNRINVRDGWYAQIVGGSTTPSVPTNGIGLKVNQVTKIWGRNTNVFLNDTTATKKAVAEEIGLFDGRTATDSVMWGMDVVNFSGKKADIGFQARSNPVGYKTAFRAEKSDIAFQSSSDTDNSAKLLSTTFNGIEEYYIKVDGEQSKLKLKAKSYVDGDVQQSVDDNGSLLFTKKTIIENFNIVTPVSKNGVHLTICNESSVTQTIGIIGGGNLFYKAPSAVGSLSIPSRGSIILVSDGAFWFVLYTSVSPITGTAAPTVVPAYVGQEFLDTTNKKVYKAFGTASSADWVILN